MTRNGSNPSHLSAIGEWVRESLKPRSLLNGLITLSWLAPLTILIWIYADRAQVVTVDDVSIPIAVRGGGNRFASLEMRDISVTAQLVGPRSRIDQIRQAINPKEDQPTVIIPIDNPPGNTYSLDTAQQIMNSSVFQYSGVSVKDCKPSQIRVFVDDFAEREVDVQSPANSNLVSGVFTPAKVTIRAPKTYLTRVGSNVTAVADFSKANVLDKPGQHDDVTVALASPELQGLPGVSLPGVSFNPSTVKASLDVRPKDASTEIKSVTIWVRLPAGFANKYVVECNPPALSNVKVTGPPSQLALLEQNPPRATLTVGNDARSGLEQTGRVSFEFMPGTENVHEVPDSVQQVKYQLKALQPPG